MPSCWARSLSSSAGGMAAAALPVANPPRTTLGVTQAGSPTSGLRLPILKVPSAMPSITCRQRSIRSRAASRTAGSEWSAAVRIACRSWWWTY